MDHFGFSAHYEEYLAAETVLSYDFPEWWVDLGVDAQAQEVKNVSG